MLAIGLAVVLAVASCNWLGGPPRSGAAPLPPGVTLERLTVDGLDRTFFVYTPKAWRDQPNRVFPAVVMFHGAGDAGGQRGRLIAANSMLTGEADRRGFVAVYPNGADGLWWPYPDMMAGKPHDVPYVEAVLDKVVEKYRVDARRVAVSGFSAGGHMAQVTACQLPNRVHALAWVGASVLDETPAYCDQRPANPIPTLMYVGSNDPINPYRGGKVNSSIVSNRPDMPLRLVVLSAQDSASYWATRNGCGPNVDDALMPDRVPSDGTRVRRASYRACPATAPVELFICEGGSHTWPGGAAKADNCGDVPITPYMLDFFASAGFAFGGTGAAASAR